METALVDNPAPTGVDNQGTEPTNGANGTNATNGQAQGGAPDEIFKGVDPNKLPPEVKAHYDSMLKDYREKTARLSETIKSESQKAAEAYKQKAESYDQIASQEAFVNKWNEYVKEQERQASQGGAQPGDPVLAKMEAKLNEMNEKMQISEAQKISDAFADAVDEKGQKINPLFDELNHIHIGKLSQGDKSEDFSLLRGCVELAQGNSPSEKLANGYKMAKAVYDGIFESGKKAGMGRLQEKAKNGTLPPTSTSSEILTMTDKKPKSAREAMEMARKGVMVSRD